MFSYLASRANEFIGTLLSSTTTKPVQVPPGLSALQEELGHICGTLLRLVSHNRAVFGEYYAEIIRNHIKGTTTVNELNGKEDTEHAVEEITTEEGK